MKRKTRIFLAAFLALIAALCLFAACGGGKKVKLSFEPNGGHMERTSYSVKVGEEFTLPEPERDGYAFEGWYESENYNGAKAPSVVTAEKNTKYYAKWSQLFKVTFDLGGGTMTVGEVPVAEGANLLSALTSALDGKVPQKSDHLFGEWLLSGNPVTESTVMPKNNITLTAHYKVKCTVEVYLQGANGYEKGETQTEYAYAGTSYTPVFLPEGYELNPDAAGSVVTKTVSENAADNAFVLYFDRARITVTYIADLPGDETAQPAVRTYSYGESVTAPEIFGQSGYLFLGWAAEEGGEVLYHTDAIASRLHGEGAPEADSFTAEKSMTLYGVWAKAYLDVFHGSDFLYLDPEEPSAAYLERGGILFKGSYRASTKLFTFNEDSTNTIDGKIVGEGAFVLYSEARLGRVSTLYQNNALEESVHLTFDEYNGVTYRRDTDLSEGTYTVDDEGEYVATFTSGPLSGKTRVFLLGTLTRITDEGATDERSVFMERNEEEFAIGRLVHYYVLENGVYNSIAPYDSITFNGFGVCSYVDQNGETQYYYYEKNEDGTYDLLYSDRENVFMTVSLDGDGEGYWTYSSALDTCYSLKDGGTLELDGCGKGKYTDKDGTLFEGYFMTAESAFGGSIIRLFKIEDPTGGYTFLVTPIIVPGIPTPMGYETEIVPNGYGEYHYCDASSVYYAPLIVMDEEGEGTAKLYGYMSDQSYALVARGKYTYDAKLMRYTFTAETYPEIMPDILTSPFDVREVKSFVFGLGIRATSTSTRQIAYWYEMTLKNESKEVYSETYKNGDAELTFIGAVVIYKDASGNVRSGSFIEDYEGYTAVVLSNGQREPTVLIVDLDEEAGTFSVISGFVGTYNALTANGSGADGDTLRFTGNGQEAIYTQKAQEEEGEDTVYNGTYRTTGEYKGQAPIYVFTADGLSFRFIMVGSSSSSYFARFAEDTAGEYFEAEEKEGQYVQKEGGTTLRLDGYGIEAVYTPKEGDPIEGNYSYADGVVELLVANEQGTVVGRIVFDLRGGKLFTARGGEADTYFLADNQEVKNLGFILDGYGHLQVYTTVRDNEGSRVEFIDREGTYARNGNSYLLSYRENNAPVEVKGHSGYLTLGGNMYRCIIAEHPESARSYVCEEDLTVITLDGYGGATRYKADGGVEEGFYTLITEGMFYYTNGGDANSFDGCIYHYDIEKGVAVASDLKEMGYYTSDLEAIRFSEYGTMVYNDTNYFYDVDADGKVTIYHRGGDAPNVYGFVGEVFGTFDAEKIWDGKTYHRSSSASVPFERASGDEGNYPIIQTENVEGEDGSTTEKKTALQVERLVFAPAGSGTFRVSGTATIGGRGYTCTVVKETDAFYFTVGNFRFDITVNYSGYDAESGSGANDNTFTVTAMHTQMSLRSETFMYEYLMLYLYLGIQIPDDFGTIDLMNEYNTSGEVGRRYVNANFGEDSLMYDANGNIVSIREKAYEFDEESGLYTVDLGELEDGYSYILRFYVTTSFVSFGASYTYRVAGFNRVQTLVSGEYTLEIERVIASDMIAMGSIYSVPTLKKNGTSIVIDPEKDDVVRSGVAKICFILRTQNEEGKAVSAKYFVLSLTEKDAEIMEGEERVPGYAPFASFTVEEKEATTRYTADGKSYVDMTADGEVLLLCIASEEEGAAPTYYMPSATTHNTDGSYTATVSDVLDYTVRIESDGMVTLTAVEKTPAPEAGE